MVAMVKKGADRQQSHEILRQLSMASWQEIQKGIPNPLMRLVQSDSHITRWLNEEEIKGLFEVEGYVGIAGTRAREITNRIRILLA